MRERQIEEIVRLQNEASEWILDEMSSLWRRQIADLPRRLADLPRSTGPLSPQDPFFVWQKMSATATASASRSFTEEWGELRNQLIEQNKRAEQSRETTFATFSPSERSKWKMSGDAFAWVPSDTMRLVLSEQGGHWKIGVQPQRFSDSRLVARPLEGTLRSETFTIEKNFLHVKGSGKGGRINVVVDGFALIRDPIYGGLAVRLNEEKSSWHTINLSKWQGHRTYLEFVDQSIANLTFPPGEATPPNGYFEIDEVVFSSHPEAPVDPPNAVNLRVLAEPAPASIEELANRYRDIAAEALEIVHAPPEGKSSSEIRSAATMIDSLFAQGLIDGELPSEMPSDKVARLRDLITQIDFKHRSWDRPN